MARRGSLVTRPPGTIAIIELSAVCEAWRRRCERAFEVAGRWATSLSAPADQRFFAEASHRHAWHAQLWAARTPSIPRGDRFGAPDGAADDSADRVLDAGADDARSAYHAHVTAMLDDLDALAGAVDPDLDPPTLRTVTLVRADVVDLRDRSA